MSDPGPFGHRLFIFHEHGMKLVVLRRWQVLEFHVGTKCHRRCSFLLSYFIGCAVLEGLRGSKFLKCAVNIPFFLKVCIMTFGKPFGTVTPLSQFCIMLDALILTCF